MQTAERQRIEGLVDIENGLVSREVFVDDELYRIEQQRVFARAWLFIGHESQIPNPGDFFVSRMGEESVLMVRDHRQEVHVFLNTCRHRGMRVCRYDEGNAMFFTCPYHGWTYAADGRLATVPLDEEAYAGRLDKSQWGLIECPRWLTTRALSGLPGIEMRRPSSITSET